MSTFGADAHYAYRIEADGQTVLLASEPKACAGGCGRYCCTALNGTGRRVLMHLPADTPITVLTVPGGGR